jgi:hypothetical protein
MITVNPITISTPTRFQVSFDLAPPYTKAEIKVAGDGKWSVQCGVVERMTMHPVPAYGTIFTEGAHNIAPHEGEGAPNVSALYNYTGVDFAQAPRDPDYPPGTYAIALDPAPHGDAGHFDKVWMVYSMKPGAARAWHVEVNIVHGSEEQVADAHRRRRGGCLLPFWWWPVPLGADHASAAYEQMLKTGEIGLEPAAARTSAKPRAKRAPAKQKASAKPKKRPK